MKKIILAIFMLIPGYLGAVDAILKYSCEEIKLGKNPWRTIEKKILILTENGRDRYGTQRINFDDEKEKIEILYARTITESGDTLPVPQNAINIVTPGEIEDYPRFSNHKRLEIAFTGAHPGSELEFKVKITSSEENKKADDLFTFRERIPVEQKILRVLVPEEMVFGYKISDEGVKVEKKNEGNIKVYTFKVQNLPEIKHTTSYYWGNPYLPPKYLISPYVEYTTYQNWDEFNLELKTKYEKALKLALKKISAEEKFLDFYKKIKLIDLDYEITGFTPLDLEEALKSNVATEAEKAVILTAFLQKYRSTNPRIVLIYNYERNRETSLPGYHNFHKILIINGDSIIDPGVDIGEIKTKRFSGYHAEDIFEEKEITIKGDSSSIVSASAILNLKDKSVKFTIEADGFSGKSAKYRLYYTPKQWRRDLIRRVIGVFGTVDSVIDSKLPDPFDLENKFQVSGSGKIEHIGIMQNKYWIITFPYFFFQILNLPDFSVESRTEPYFIPQPLELILNYTLVFPENTEIVGLPDEFESARGPFHLSETVKKSENKIDIKIMLRIDRRYIPTELFSELEIIKKEFGSQERRIIVLKRMF